ncbi:MAG TPA: POT family MFS transporter [Pirellulales bacterium]|nr:POT family MFS transporter [Pirellulales bacterium]
MSLSLAERLRRADERAGYRTAPEPRTTMPPGIPYIVGNEAAERFSYYGMTAILVMFMTTQLRDSAGNPDLMTEIEARRVFHHFVTAVYLIPLFGALLADTLLGKYRTIVSLSLVYCLGHLALALDQTRLGLYVGLGLIAVGAGGVKPCVSAHVGDQFGESNRHLLERVFGWFYFSINLGAAASQVLIPYLRKEAGPHVAFGLPGILMFLATLVFWLGRHKFVHIPPGGTRAFSADGWRALARLVPIYLCVAVFFSLFDQTHSAWVLQARSMDRHFLGLEIEPDQLQAINPVLIMILVPLFSYVVYPALGRTRFAPVTPLKKIAIGMFITVPSFAIVAGAQQLIDAGQTPHFGWQAIAYLVLTAAEVMVSITTLEFSYTQAPNRMKSLVMAMYLAAVALGNQFAAQVNHAMEHEDIGRALAGANYYWFFTALMLVAAVAFVFIAMRYRPHTFVQHEQPN